MRVRSIAPKYMASRCCGSMSGCLPEGRVSNTRGVAMLIPVSSSVEQSAVNGKVVGPTPTLGAMIRDRQTGKAVCL